MAYLHIRWSDTTLYPQYNLVATSDESRTDLLLQDGTAYLCIDLSFEAIRPQVLYQIRENDPVPVLISTQNCVVYAEVGDC